MSDTALMLLALGAFVALSVGGMTLVVSAPYTWSGKWRWRWPWQN